MSRELINSHKCCYISSLTQTKQELEEKKREKKRRCQLKNLQNKLQCEDQFQIHAGHLTRTETLWVMLQRTTSINDWCSSRGTSNVQKHTHKHTRTKKKPNKILQVALVIKSNVASFTLSAQTFMRKQHVSVRYQTPIFDPVIHFKTRVISE